MKISIQKTSNTAKSVIKPNDFALAKQGQNGAEPLDYGEHHLEAFAAQNGTTWIKVTVGNGSMHFPLDQLVDGSTFIFRKVTGMGSPLVTIKVQNKFREAVQNLSPEKNIIIAAQPGYQRIQKDGKSVIVAYITPGGDIIRSSTIAKNDPLEISFEKNHKSKIGGDFEKYQALLGPLIKGQPLPLLMFCFALAPLFQPFVPTDSYVENTVIDLTGRTSTGKSTIATAIAGGVWGTGGKTGFFETWNNTGNKLELKLPNFNNALFGIDEATLAGKNARERAEVICNIVHRISNGEVKGRMNAEESLPFQTIAISTSNQPLPEIISESNSVAGGIGVRIMTFVLPEKQSHVFKNLPAGYNSIVEVAAKLHNIALQHHGHLPLLVAKKIIEEHNLDPDLLAQRIGNLIASFMNSSGIDLKDPLAVRTLKPVALAYASGVLAKKFGIISGKKFGMFGDSLTQSLKYLKIKKTFNLDCRNRFLKAIQSREDEVVIVRGGNYPKMTKIQTKKTFAFIVISNRGQMVAAFSPHSMRTHFPNYELDLQKIRAAKKLKHDKNQLTTKLRARISVQLKKPMHERFYAILLDEMPF